MDNAIDKLKTALSTAVRPTFDKKFGELVASNLNGLSVALQ